MLGVLVFARSVGRARASWVSGRGPSCGMAPRIRAGRSADEDDVVEAGHDGAMTTGTGTTATRAQAQEILERKQSELVRERIAWSGGERPTGITAL